MMRLAPTMQVMLLAGVAALVSLSGSGCSTPHSRPMTTLDSYVLDFQSPCDPDLQARLEILDTTLRTRHGMSREQASIGLLDLRQLRLALLQPDLEQYAASVAKIGIMLAWFQLRPASATNLDGTIRHELGLMIKASNNDASTRFSRELGLRPIQAVINSHHLYDAQHGGGLWVGKHYGRGGERFGDPVGNNAHAATVRQLLRFYLLLEQGRLVSPQASARMREVFKSPQIPHDQIKFVQGLAGRDVEILRKWGTWEDWRHDSAVITGPGRHYILVALTHHPKGDDYIVELAREVDAMMTPRD